METANYYPFLQEHVYSLLRKDVSYMSLTSQNELNELVGKHTTNHEKFIEDAQYHSVSADKVTGSNDEIL